MSTLPHGWTEARLRHELGMYWQPGVGAAYPDFLLELDALYRDSASGLPFLPADWYDAVAEIMRTGNLLKPAPTLPYGQPAKDMPRLLKDADQVAAWDRFAGIVAKAYEALAAGKVKEGQAIVRAANRKAAFINAVYASTKAVSDLPGSVASAVGGGVWRVLTSSPWLIGVALVVALWLLRPLLVAGAAAAKGASRGRE